MPNYGERICQLLGCGKKFAPKNMRLENRQYCSSDCATIANGGRTRRYRCKACKSAWGVPTYCRACAKDGYFKLKKVAYDADSSHEPLLIGRVSIAGWAWASRPLLQREVDEHRELNCDKYDRCLREALKAVCPSWSCINCPERGMHSNIKGRADEYSGNRVGSIFDNN